MTSELETNIVAVERVSEYTKIKNEVQLTDEALLYTLDVHLLLQIALQFST